MPYDGAELLALWNMMVRVCEPILASRDDAEDCASDTVVAALSLPDPSSIDNRHAWFVTVARRRAADQLRARARVRAHPRHAPAGDAPVQDVAERVVDRAEARWVARRADALLTPAARDVLGAVADAESVEDAACALGITRRAAEAHLHRARRTLRRHLL